MEQLNFPLTLTLTLPSTTLYRPLRPTVHYTLPSTTPYRPLHPTVHYALPSTTPYRPLHPTVHYALPSTTPYRPLRPTVHYTLPSTTPYRPLRNTVHYTLPSATVTARKWNRDSQRQVVVLVDVKHLLVCLYYYSSKASAYDIQELEYIEWASLLYRSINLKYHCFSTSILVIV